MRIILLSLFLVFLVVGTCSAVMIRFFKRLRRIEDELWGQKRREAIETAAAEQAEATEPETL